MTTYTDKQVADLLQHAVYCNNTRVQFYVFSSEDAARRALTGCRFTNHGMEAELCRYYATKEKNAVRLWFNKYPPLSRIINGRQQHVAIAPNL